MKMKQGILMVIVLMMIVLVGCSAQKNNELEPKISLKEEQSVGEEIKSEYQELTPQQAKQMIDAEEYVVLLDVRTPEEYAQGHIEGALLLPDYEIGEKAESILIDKDATILIYCRSGRRSELAARELLALGYASVYDFGGIIDCPYGVVKE
jgi:rhodanese-related sulfurtransferase